MIRRLWNWFWRPSRRFGLGLLLLIGGVGGVIFWGAFNTFMEYTNTLQFCTSCHEMSTVYSEYQKSVHAKNASGVSAICADCHVPKPWIDKLIRKIKATNELYHKAIGTIDTPEKFEKHRIDLAEKVWAEMTANNSQECRNCHSYATMDFHKQRKEAAQRMEPAAQKGETCINCHKGIAHKMPDLGGRARERATAFMTRTEELKADALWTKRSSALYAEPDKESAKAASILPGVSVTKLERKGDFVKVRVEGWQAGDVVRGQYAAFGKRILNLSITQDAVDKVSRGEKKFYEEGNQDWTRTAFEGWIASEDLTEDQDMLWTVSRSIYTSQCGVCHSAAVPESRNALTWQADVQAYQPRTSLTPEEGRLVLRFLQVHAADMKTPGP